MNRNKINVFLFYVYLLLRAQDHKISFLTSAAFPEQGIVTVLR